MSLSNTTLFTLDRPTCYTVTSAIKSVVASIQHSVTCQVRTDVLQKSATHTLRVEEYAARNSV